MFNFPAVVGPTLKEPKDDEDAQIFSDFLQEYWPSDELEPRQPSDESQLFYDFAKEHKFQQLVETYTRVQKEDRTSILDYIRRISQIWYPALKFATTALLAPIMRQSTSI
jgi:hypothetical protein